LKSPLADHLIAQNPLIHALADATGMKSPRFFHLISQARQNIFRSADRLFSDALGISGTQAIALFAVKKEEGCQLRQLAQQLQLKDSAITGLVARMVEGGLILRKPCPDDGRASSLYVTKKGVKILEKALPLFGAINTQLKSDFSTDEHAVVARFLERAKSIDFRIDSTS
jgi:MarR family transcriptional regulator, organic hydroperoxide resistance regulator